MKFVRSYRVEKFIMTDGKKWYALYTKARHEKKVEKQIAEKSIQAYLPMNRVLRQWSDRKQWVEEPLFRSYLFVRADKLERYSAIQVYGAVHWVTFRGEPAIVPDREIDTIQRILRESPSVEACQDLETGEEVEITHGPMTGIRGKIDEFRGEGRIVVSVPSIRQALRFNVNRSEVRAVASPSGNKLSESVVL
jgi:transcription antitermination factor NusG